MTRVVEWLLGIVGVIAAACGGVILHTEDLRVVLGDLSWMVAQNVESVWGYVLLIGGAVVAIGMVVLAVAMHRREIGHTGHTTTLHPAM